MKYEDLVAFIKAARETANDDVALKAKELYKTFDQIKGTYQKKGTRCRCEVDGEWFLFKLTCEDQTEQGTFIVENWNPVDAVSIWTAIDEVHTGTLEDPIPATRGMEYTKGLYYIEDGKIYLMNRKGMADGEKITLQYVPSELVGQYFELV